MSSLRNAVHRREHRERGQLQSREKWGLLEKHKDYSLRARDYNEKKAKLKRLREKAEARNPDEFAFGMMAEGTRRAGKHGARDSAAARGLSHEAIKLLKTQDAGYLRTVGERVRREMEKVEREVKLQEGMKTVLGEEMGEESGQRDEMMEDDEDEDEDGFGRGRKDDKKGRTKVVFADDRDEQLDMKRRWLYGDEEEEGEEDDDDEDDSFGAQMQNQKMSRKQLEAKRQALVEERRARKIKKRAAQARQHKLASLQNQYKDIVAAERELDWQRGKMDNSVGGTNKNGVKWRIKERKK